MTHVIYRMRNRTLSATAAAQIWIRRFILPRAAISRRLSLPDIGSEHIGRSNVISCNKINLLRILLCVWISMIIEDLKIVEKSQNQQKCQCSRRPTASSRQSTANQHGVFDVSCKCIVGKRTVFPGLKPTTSHWLFRGNLQSRMRSQSWTYAPFSKSG